MPSDWGAYPIHGSSPRVWGQVTVCHDNVVHCGIIPTRMGTSHLLSQRYDRLRDHPHAYGDKEHRSQNLQAFLGSSPRVWGQARFTLPISPLRGIIPTRMGTSCICRCTIIFFGDHPHAYGDKLPDTLITATSSGSSPRVWGQENISICIAYIFRIIPTRMGTSCYVKPILSIAEDHPHAYGDKQRRSFSFLRL